MLRKDLFCVLLFAVGSPLPGFGNDIDRDWLEKLKSESAVSLNKYLARSPHLEETAEIRTEADPEKKDPKARNQTVKITARRLGNRFMFERQVIVDGHSQQPVIQLQCANEDYQFVLRKKAVEAPYALASYSPARAGGMLEGAGLHSHAYDALREIQEAVLGKEGYTLKRVHYDNGKRVLRVGFDSKRGSAKAPVVVKNEVCLDPDHDWRVCEMVMESPVNTTVIQVTYGDPVDGLTFPSRVIESVRMRTKGVETAYQMDMKLDVRRTTKEPADFRLSAFGIPEPAEFAGRVPTRKIPTYLFILAGSAVCAIIAVACRRWGRRLRAPVAA